MASIIRNGKAINLTEDEIFAIRQAEHRKDVEYDVEEEVLLQEGDGWISFSSWADSGEDYESSSDARADFISKIAEDILEAEELYDRDPRGYVANLSDTVSEYAEDFGYWKGEC